MNEPPESLSLCKPGKQGIALIVSLGILSVLALMAVAFAVSMRTERMASSNSLFQSKARYMTRTAVARALTTIDGQLTSNGVVYLPDGKSAVLSSGGSELAADLLVGEAAKFLNTESSNAISSAMSGTEPSWLDIPDPGGSGEIIGRVAFALADASGFLDVNYAGGSLNRSDGSDPSEISLTNALIPELDMDGLDAGPSGMSELVAARLTNSLLRFDSIADLYIAGRYGQNMTGTQMSDPFLQVQPNGWPTILSVFTRSENAMLEGTLSGGTKQMQVPVSQTPADLYADLKGLLTAAAPAFSGVPDIDMFVRNLVDYVDTDNIPGNAGGAAAQLNTFCTEPVPMFNEIGFDATFTQVGADVVVQISPSVELFYPFEGLINNYEYQAQLAFRFSGGPITTPLVQMATVSFPDFWDSSDPYKMNDSAIASFDFTIPGTTLAALSMAGTQVEILGNLTQIGDGNPTVDELPRNPEAVLVVSLNYNPLNPRPMGIAVNDPRLNYLNAEWQFVQDMDVTPDAENTSTVLSYTGADQDGRLNLYVRNAPMRTVGEIGFLMYKPSAWTSVNLLGADPDDSYRLIDYITTAENDFTRGLVNPNSQYANVLASVFLSAPVDDYPGSPPQGEVDLSQAEDLARILHDATQSGTLFTNRSDVLALLTAPDIQAIVAEAVGDVVLTESVVRNSIGLFSAAGTTYMGVVAGQSVKDSLSPGSVQPEEVRGEQRAFVILWRSPFPDSNGKHPGYVRFFRWLGESNYAEDIW